MFWPNLKFVALPIPEIIAIGFLGDGCEPPILGKRRPYWVGVVLFKIALVSSYRPSIVTFPLYLRVSDILPLLCCSSTKAAILLQRATFSHHTSIVSPKFPYVPLGVGVWPLGYEERRC